MTTANTYVQTHREVPPPPGLLVLRADFGAPAPEPPPAPPPGDVRTELEWRLQEIQRLVQQAQADRCAYDATLAVYRASMAQIMDHDIGPIWDYARECRELLASLPNGAPPPGPTPGPVPPPAPNPPPETLQGFGGSYPGHDPAVDCYLGWTAEQVQWGPHHGLPLLAPADCTVEAYSFPTPLSVYQQMTAEQRAAARALFAGWTCGAWAEAGAWHAVNDNLIDPLQIMYVAVVRFAQPFVIDGVPLQHLHLGHVHPQIATGRRAKGEQFGQTWDSGIRFEQAGNPVARAAHVHTAASTRAELTPNGNVSGLYAARAMGWLVQPVARVPGPEEYRQPYQYTAGRRYAEFQQAGRPIPPIPA